MPAAPRTQQHRTPPISSANPYTRPTPQTGSSPLLKDADEAFENVMGSPTPATSARSVSEYAPNTPPSDKRVEIEELELDELDDEDVKPEVTESEDDVSGARPKGKRKAATAAAKGKAKVGTRAGPTAWTREQDWILFKHLHPKAKPDWKMVAFDTGRKSQSCMQRYALLSKKLEGVIKGIGGS